MKNILKKAREFKPTNQDKENKRTQIILTLEIAEELSVELNEQEIEKLREQLEELLNTK